jgi:hypothetical protein
VVKQKRRIIFHFVWIIFNLDNLEKYSGMDEATSEDLAFTSLLGGGTASLSPFQRSPSFANGSLPPLLGQDLNSCPATKGAYPLAIPQTSFLRNDVFLEGTRLSRVRGLFEHDSVHRAVLVMTREYLGVRFDEHAEFRRAEKVDERMA